MMSVSMLGGAFAFAIIMHNLEEAILLPKWSRTLGVGILSLLPESSALLRLC